MTEHHYQQFRKDGIIEEVCVRIASTFAINGSPSFCVGLQDIGDVFPDAQRFKLDGLPVPFLTDPYGNRIEPPCISFYPHRILDVITKAPQSSNESTINYLPTSSNSAHLASQVPLLPSPNLIQSLNPLHTIHSSAQFEAIISKLEKIAGLLLEAKEKDNKMSDILLQAKEKDDRLIALLLEAKEKDSEITKLQNMLMPELNTKEEDVNKGHQAPKSLAILQKHAHTILSQQLELHECPIPRLFILLPVDNTKWDPLNVVRNKFRLHFLCECGDHSAMTSKSSQSPIHITKHDGYEVRDSTEFFRKYGKYMFILLQWLKFGVHSSASLESVPYLINPGIDRSIDYMQSLSREDPALSNITAIDDYEGLVGAEFRRLSTFLRSKDEDKKFGNLSRIATEAGHVKWVCLDHYTATYRGKGQKAFESAVKMHGGIYDSHLGKAIITFKPINRARELFDALTSARHVYELDITFDWDWTETDLEAFESALTLSSVLILRLGLGRAPGSVSRKAFLTSTQHEALVRIMELSNIKTIHIVLPLEFITLLSLQLKPAHLHKLSFKMNAQSIGASELLVLVNTLKANAALTILDLKSSSIGKEGALALSEALKTNTTLITLDLRGNSIGDEGVLALSGSLKVNTTLTTLNLAKNSIEKEGALALSKALKINTALTTLDLRINSVGDEGALGLSEALKTNTTLVTLDLWRNLVGNEGALALSKSLNVNTALTTLNLANNSIGDEGVLALSRALKANTALTFLVLRANSVGEKGALGLSEALKTNSALATLDLGVSSIRDEGTLSLSEALKINTTLTALDLWDNSIGVEGAFSLSVALKTNMTLTTLNLGSNSIGREGILRLSEALKTNTALTTLNLWDNSIGKEGALALSEVLKINRTLITLDMGVNSIGNEGTVSLSEALKNNTTLTTLDLWRNSIGNEGALSLSELLKANTSLNTLRLGRNSFGKEGAQALSQALKANTTLTTLSLRGNPIGDEGVLALSEALKNNMTLVNLDLKSSSIGYEGVLALSKALKVNTTLNSLELGSNSFGKEGALALAEARRTNVALIIYK